MFETTFEPRFNETDALGHINNSVFLTWFEHARIPIFRIFTPDLDPKKWELIIARTETDYLKQVLPSSEVLVKTWLSKIGNSSMTVEHELFQFGEKAAHGRAVMIRFDYARQKASPLESSQRALLEKHLAPKP